MINKLLFTCEIKSNQYLIFPGLSQFLNQKNIFKKQNLPSDMLEQLIIWCVPENKLHHGTHLHSECRKSDPMGKDSFLSRWIKIGEKDTETEAQRER